VTRQETKNDGMAKTQHNQEPVSPAQDQPGQNDPNSQEASTHQDQVEPVSALPGMTPQPISFPNKNTATLIRPPAGTSIDDMITALGLEPPTGLLLMVGGSTELDENVEIRLVQLYSRGLARAAADAEAMILDGARDTGTVAITGRGVADRGHKSQLVGVSLASKVTYPGGPTDGKIPDGEALEPNHSHFILTEGDVWGDESETLFELAKTLAQDKQIITVLVNGDDIAKKQILESVRHDWPVIVIRGSGGLADELAKLWNKRPAFIPDPDLAEIMVDGKLHFFQLGRSIGEFERRLEQLLRFQEADSVTTLELVWHRFAEYDQNANRQQRSFARIQGSILILGVLGTALALTEFTFKTLVDVNDNLTYLAIERTMYYLLLTVPITITALIAAANRFSAGNKWIFLRASAESIKKEIYRYRARTEIYSDSETKSISRERKLERKVELLSSKLMQTEVNVSALKPYNGPIPPKYGAAPGDDGLSFLTPERYMTYRLQDQLNWYRNRTVKLENRLKRLQWLIYIAGGVGTLLVAVGLELWIALTTALVTSLAAYLEYQQVEPTLMRYNQTATDLSNVRSWWVALSPEEESDPINIDKLVAQTETTIHSEHASWVQEMQDAMAELRAEQTSTEGQEQDSDKKKSRRTTTDTLIITKVKK
jgi:hypothetical protein